MLFLLYWLDAEAGRYVGVVQGGSCCVVRDQHRFADRVSQCAFELWSRCGIRPAYLLFPLSGAAFHVDWLPKDMQKVVMLMQWFQGTEILREGCSATSCRHTTTSIHGDLLSRSVLGRVPCSAKPVVGWILMLSVERVSKVYSTRAGRHKVLQDVSFSVGTGGHLGILGRNGAGIHLIRLISGANAQHPEPSTAA